MDHQARSCREESHEEVVEDNIHIQTNTDGVVVAHKGQGRLREVEGDEEDEYLEHLQSGFVRGDQSSAEEKHFVPPSNEEECMES